MNIAEQDISLRLKTEEDEAFFARFFYAYAPCVMHSVFGTNRLLKRVTANPTLHRL
jgi:hypothetical protein